MPKTEEAPVVSAPEPQKTIVERMAEEPYYQITLAESANPDFKWGSHYVGVNEYSIYLPRETPMMVAESLLKIMDQANRANTYLDSEGRRQTQRRPDVQIVERMGPFSAEQAHAKRLVCTDERGEFIPGAMPVFPTKIPAALASKLASKLKGTTK